jgi:hypothetical protein
MKALLAFLILSIPYVSAEGILATVAPSRLSFDAMLAGTERTLQFTVSKQSTGFFRVNMTHDLPDWIVLDRTEFILGSEAVAVHLTAHPPVDAESGSSVIEVRMRPASAGNVELTIPVRIRWQVTDEASEDFSIIILDGILEDGVLDMSYMIENKGNVPVDPTSINLTITEVKTGRTLRKDIEEPYGAQAFQITRYDHSIETDFKGPVLLQLSSGQEVATNLMEESCTSITCSVRRLLRIFHAG